MEDMGLAATVAEPPAAGEGGSQEITIEDIVYLLMQGADPQELVQMGIPPEVIEQVLQMIAENGATARQESTMPAGPQGLAAQSAMMG